MQSAQSVSAAYYFNLAARDYSLAADAIELIIERVPCSAFIEPSQGCELIFCARLDRLRGRKHAGDGGKFRRDLQEQSRHAMNVESVSCPRLIQSGALQATEQIQDQYDDENCAQDAVRPVAISIPARRERSH
jgi:hypothetical protein